MKPSPSYLTRNRHGTFYFRIVIPRPLRALLRGQREVRRTLKTDSERLARKRARQYVARYEAVFDKVVNMVERDELGLTEADYKELMELLPEAKPTPDFSSPGESTAEETALSDEEIENRQRRREVERLLTGAYGRSIPVEQEKHAQELMALTRNYQPTELRKVLPKLREKLMLNQAGLASGTPVIAPATPTTAPAVDPAYASWTLYDVWKDQLERDRADTTAKGGQAKHAGDTRRARTQSTRNDSPNPAQPRLPVD